MVKFGLIFCLVVNSSFAMEGHNHNLRLRPEIKKKSQSPALKAYLERKKAMAAAEKAHDKRCGSIIDEIRELSQEQLKQRKIECTVKIADFSKKYPGNAEDYSEEIYQQWEYLDTEDRALDLLYESSENSIDAMSARKNRTKKK